MVLKLFVQVMLLSDPGFQQVPLPNCITFTNGMVETGNYAIYALSTTSAHVVNASSLSYINGALGRGMSNIWR